MGLMRWWRSGRARALLASPWWRGAAALLAGALPALAFPAPGLWWFAYVALVPWLLLARGAPTARRAALDGWLGGTGFVLAVHHWLLPSLHVFLLPLAALLGALWIPWGMLARHLLAGSPGPGRAAWALLVLPSGWLLSELARSWQGLGGPWGLLGASQWQVPAARRLASVGGVWLVSAVVVAVNCAWVLLLAREPGPGPRGRRTATVGLGGVTACAVLTGAVWAWAPRPEVSGLVRVALVQPGMIDGPDAADVRFAAQERLTRQLVGTHPDLVVWGESSVGADLAARPDLARRLARLSAEVGAPLLVNVDARRSDRPGIFKSSVLVGPSGPTGQRYDKMRLVPFGEYVPARSLLGWATSVGRAADEDRRRGSAQVVMRLPARAAGQDGAGGAGRSAGAPRADARPGTGTTPGTAPDTAPAAGLPVGPLVCFESAFPDMSRRLARDGAALLVAQSATSTFQDSWAPAQHASLAALRAAETGRPFVHATLTGVSVVRGPGGEQIGARLGTDRRAAAVYDVPLAHGTTLYVRLGDWVPYGALLVLVALCGREALRTVRPLRPPAPALPAPPVRTARG
ncbi:apolipoprotein N-acyltransferase [Streptomyces sp. NPDC093225]|uniref:apolipoprotein N-acyltransferase n=1 Tax=Streptomyces sp. NPDC093225 TaxID=3366034 RepID=UPI0038172333